jgi:hypothetical protein
MNTQVYAFAQVPDERARMLVYQQIKAGKSRFGMWDQKKSLKEEYHGKNGFLLRLHKDDWIVHVNCPEYGKCVAVKVTGEYSFDTGIVCEWGMDFCNYFEIDPTSIIEFARVDPNVLPSVNLSPMRRGQRILAVEDFLESIKNLRERKYTSASSELRGIVHLRDKIGNKLLPQISEMIHNMNKSKEFERFLHHIFGKLPNTQSVQNGFGWGTDHGADLIVDFQNPINGISLTSKLVVQAKSYEGEHYDLNAVDQIVKGIEMYKADGGLLITTAKRTEALDKYIQSESERIGKTIDLIAGDDVARFVIRYAPEILLG